MNHHSKTVACQCDIFNQYTEEISQIQFLLSIFAIKTITNMMVLNNI